MIKMNKKITFLAVFLFSIFVVFAIPKDPNVFYGTVTLNGNSNVNGILKLYVNDVLQDNISVVNGVFGGPGVFDEKLTATGQNGDTVKFVLVVQNYNITPITQPYEEGKVEQISLAFEGTLLTVSSGGGRGSSEEEEEQGLELPQNQTIVENETVVNQTITIENQTTETENQTIEELEEELLKEMIVENVSEILEKYNVSGSFEDLEIESLDTIEHASEINEEKIKDLEEVVDKNTLSKLEKVIKSGAKIVVKTLSKYYKVKDKKSGKLLHILDIKSTAKFENVEAENVVWIEQIPKSVAQHVSFVHFKTKPSEIVNPDPVVRFVMPYNPEQEIYTIEYEVVTENEAAKEDVKSITHIVIPEAEEETAPPSTQTATQPTEETEKQEEVTPEETVPKESKILKTILIVLGVIVIVVIGLVIGKLLKSSRKQE